MRTTIQVDDPGVVNHLHVHNQRPPGLNNAVVAVVGVRKHGRTRRGKRQALILKPRVFGAFGVFLGLDAAAFDIGGRWRERLNSDAREYGGSGSGNLGSIEASPLPAHGRFHSLSLRLPPLAVLILTPD